MTHALEKEIQQPMDKIESIVYDYAQGYQHDKLIITTNELKEIAYRIVTEIMEVNDDNAFVNLIDLTKIK
jgi:3-deoxy-D-arabino-heptulosonate 7-phosphate (DAHP) synthase